MEFITRTYDKGELWEETWHYLYFNRSEVGRVLLDSNGAAACWKRNGGDWQRDSGSYSRILIPAADSWIRERFGHSRNEVWSVDRFYYPYEERPILPKGGGLRAWRELFEVYPERGFWDAHEHINMDHRHRRAYVCVNEKVHGPEKTADLLKEFASLFLDQNHKRLLGLRDPDGRATFDGIIEVEEVDTQPTGKTKVRDMSMRDETIAGVDVPVFEAVCRHLSAQVDTYQGQNDDIHGIPITYRRMWWSPARIVLTGPDWKMQFTCYKLFDGWKFEEGQEKRLPIAMYDNNRTSGHIEVFNSINETGWMRDMIYLKLAGFGQP